MGVENEHGKICFLYIREKGGQVSFSGKTAFKLKVRGFRLRLNRIKQAGTFTYTLLDQDGDLCLRRSKSGDVDELVVAFPPHSGTYIIRDGMLEKTSDLNDPDLFCSESHEPKRQQGSLPSELRAVLRCHQVPFVCVTITQPGDAFHGIIKGEYEVETDGRVSVPKSERKKSQWRGAVYDADYVIAYKGQNSSVAYKFIRVCSGCDVLKLDEALTRVEQSPGR